MEGLRDTSSLFLSEGINSRMVQRSERETFCIWYIPHSHYLGTFAYAIDGELAHTFKVAGFSFASPSFQAESLRSRFLLLLPAVSIPISVETWSGSFFVLYYPSDESFGL